MVAPRLRWGDADGNGDEGAGNVDRKRERGQREGGVVDEEQPEGGRRI